MGKVFAYIDNSNFHIGGQQISAVREGLASSLDEAMDKRISNYQWRAHYPILRNILFRGRPNGHAKIWGSPASTQGFWSHLGNEGFEPVRYGRSLSTGKEKKVDTAIAYQMGKDFPMFTRRDEIILVSGDKDFCPAVEDIAASGLNITICSWTHSTSRELLELATDFLPLDDFHETLGFLVTDALVLSRPEPDDEDDGPPAPHP